MTSFKGMSSTSGTSVRQDPYSMVYIQEKALSLGSELGQGEFGSVLRGTYKTPEGRLVRTLSLSLSLFHFFVLFQIDVAVKTLRVDAMGHGEKVYAHTLLLLFIIIRNF